jgi:hypothetical protein
MSKDSMSKDNMKKKSHAGRRALHPLARWLRSSS